MKRLGVILALLILIAGSAQAKRHKHRSHHRRHHRRVSHGIVSIPKKPGIDRKWSMAVGRRIRRSNPAHAAFVAIDANTGRILAMAQYNRSRKSRVRPAYSARFPAASVFKIVTSAALLSTRKVFPWTKVCYHGGRAGIGWGNLRHSRLDRHCRNLQMAFAHSTNAVLARLAAKYLSNKSIYKFARRFGFNHRWKLRGLHTSRVSRPNNRLTRARMAAGFTHVHMSPVHASVIAAIVANGGRLVSPHWGKTASTGKKKSLRTVKKKKSYAKEPVISHDVAVSLQKMMQETTARGTAAKYLSWARKKGLVVGCKTGTLTGSGLRNSWMVCFVRSSKKNIAFAVLSANTGHYRKSGPIAVAAVRYLLKKEKTQKVKKVTAVR